MGEKLLWKPAFWGLETRARRPLALQLAHEATAGGLGLCLRLLLPGAQLEPLIVLAMREGEFTNYLFVSYEL